MGTAKPCVHELREGGTLVVTKDARRRYAKWSACCTACRQWTGWMMTREEAVSRAKKGWWVK